jgi:hypothetical protein
MSVPWRGSRSKGSAKTAGVYPTNFIGSSYAPGIYPTNFTGSPRQANVTGVYPTNFIGASYGGATDLSVVLTNY